MYIVLSLLGIMLFVCILILTIYAKEYNQIDQQYGKPYKARLVKLTGTHPQLRSGIYSLAFHPKGVISINQKVIAYSEIQSLEIVEQVEKGEHNWNYLVLSVKDEYGENQLFISSKTEFIEIANELQRAWLKSQIYRLD
jgi:hypothetical protein